MDILRRGCAGGGGPSRKIFQASLQHCQVQSRRGSGKTRHVVQKWIRDPILYVNIRLIKLKAFSSNLCCSYDAVKNVKPAKEWRDEECEVSSRSQFDGAHLVISKTALGDAGTYRYRARLIRHSLHSHSASVYSQLSKTPLQFYKTATSSLNFQKRVSKVSFLLFFQSSAECPDKCTNTLPLSGNPYWFSLKEGCDIIDFSQILQMPGGLPARSDHLRQQPAECDHAAPGAGDHSWSRPHPRPGRHLAPGQVNTLLSLVNTLNTRLSLVNTPGQGGGQPRAGVSGEGRPAPAQPHLVDRQPPPGPGVHSVRADII